MLRTFIEDVPNGPRARRECACRGRGDFSKPMTIPEPTDRTGALGIIGAGRIGQALARTALRAGRKVVIANSAAPETLAPVVDALGAGVSADTVRDAAAARIVAIAVPWPRVAAAVAGCSGTVRPSPTPQLVRPLRSGWPHHP